MEYESLRGKSKTILERKIKPWEVYRIMKGCILEANLVISSVEISSKKRGKQKKRRGFRKLFWMGGGQMIYLGKGRVYLWDQE